MPTRLVKSMSCVLSLAVAFGIGTAVGQQAPPKENKGLAVDKTATIDLGGEIEGMQGRQLRLRVLKLDPGGVIGVHSHKDRPTVAYVLEGTLTEHPDGGAMKQHPAGSTVTAGKETTHWEENKGTTPLVLLVADILKQ